MRVTFDPSARFGFQYGIELEGAFVHRLSRDAVVEHLRGKQFTHQAIREAIAAAKADAVTVGEVRAEAVQRFIDANCHAVPGALIPFREFYSRFLASLPHDERYRWTHYRAAHALPKAHPCGAHTNNQKFVANLSWEPLTPSNPFIVIAGDKYQGRARVLAQL